jgi:enoyl-CoA hydratase/carnithine racemase
VIELERKGAVFVLRMKAGENRINATFLEEYQRALDEVEDSDGDAALVTTGEGRFYSNGLDLAWLATEGLDKAGALLTELNRLFAHLLAFPTITVAAINGHAFAAGAMLALAHDVRVMRNDRGYLCLPEIDLRTGRPLTPGMVAVLRARLRPDVLHQMLTTGWRYPAEVAVERGMVHEAHAEHDVLPRAIELASELAGKHRPTMAALKRGLYDRELAVLAEPVPNDFLSG